MTCLICHRPIHTAELPYCATRHTDGLPVCPACTEKVRAGNRDALDKLHGSKPVREVPA